jgi:hypothetical protein
VNWLLINTINLTIKCHPYEVVLIHWLLTGGGLKLYPQCTLLRGKMEVQINLISWEFKTFVVFFIEDSKFKDNTAGLGKNKPTLFSCSLYTQNRTPLTKMCEPFSTTTHFRHQLWVLLFNLVLAPFSYRQYQIQKIRALAYRVNTARSNKFSGYPPLANLASKQSFQLP